MTREKGWQYVLGCALLGLACSVAPALISVAVANDETIILDEEDEDHESGFGIRLPWWGSKKDSPDVEPDSNEAIAAEPDPESAPDSPVAPAPKPEQELIILDEEDEDGESGFGIPLRFWGSKAEREADAKEKGYEPADPESYRVIIDEEDESNESGFGIPLPTEDNPTPWRKQSSAQPSAQPSAADEYDELLEDD